MISDDMSAVDISANGSLLLLLLLVVVAVSSLWWMYSAPSTSRRRVEAPLPSPRAPLPRWMGFLGGHTLRLDQEKMIQQFEGWADEFGGDYELHIFGKKTRVITNVAEMRRILSLRPSKFKRGLTATQMHWAAGKLGVVRSMFFDEGKEWGRSRRLISPSMNEHNIAGMVPVISELGGRLCDKLGVLAENGDVVDAVEELERFTHDVVALVVLGIDADSVRATTEKPCPSFDGMRTLIDALMSLMCRPSAMVGWVCIPWLLPWVRRTNDYSQQLRDIVVRRIAEVRRESGADSGTSTSGGTLLRKVLSASERDAQGTARADSKGSSTRSAMSEDEIVEQAKSLFLAGTGTTALTLSWTVYYLARYPEIAARCREEALRVAPSSDGLVSTSEQLSQLVYTSAVFKESLRLRTPGTILFLHSTEDIPMKDGRVMEKGSAANILLRYASLSEDAFTRAKDFVPERWIESEREEALLGKEAGKDGGEVAHQDQAFLSFGAGPRICPGVGMAKAEASIIIAALCARFDLALAPGQADPPEEIMTFTSGPRAVKLVLSKRTA